MFVPLLALVLAPWAGAQDLRGGIEIGSSGVKKPTVLEIIPPASPNGTASYRVKFMGEPPDLSKLTEAAGVEKDAAAVEKNVLWLHDKGVLPGKIRVFGSSGLSNEGNYRCKLENAVNAKIVPLGIAPMEIITVENEVDWTIAGLVPDKTGQKGILFADVGNGNTKGGTLGANGEYVRFYIDLGSGSYQRAVQEKAPGRPFPEAAAQLRPDLLEKPLACQIAAKPDLTNRPKVYLSGGAVYYMAWLTHPGDVHMAIHPRPGDDHKTVTVSIQDIADYRSLIRELTDGLLRSLSVTTDSDVQADTEKVILNVMGNRLSASAIPDSNIRADAVKQIRTIMGMKQDQKRHAEIAKAVKTNSETLIGGAEILIALRTALHLQGKTLIFDPDSGSAWIRGAIIQPEPVRPSPQSLPSSWPTATVPPVPSPIESPTGLPQATGAGLTVPGVAVPMWSGQAGIWGRGGMVFRNQFRPHQRLRRTRCAGR
jgi:hypothetical protein